MNGNKIAGGNPKNGRVANDFYATNPTAVDKLLDAVSFECKHFLEPCVGNGNIADVIKLRFPQASITAVDIVDRGYATTVKADFLDWETSDKFDTIITNPPFYLASEFIEKSMELLSDGGKMAMFLKIQFLESETRMELLEKFPPKYIYVFRKRMNVWANGVPNNDATTICFAWFVWEKGSTSEPVIRWL